MTATVLFGRTANTRYGPHRFRQGGAFTMSQKRTPNTIPGFRKSYALVLNDPSVPVNTAVVFVHEFGGSPTETWTFFQNLVDEYSPDYPSWTHCDMIFFSHDSRKTPIGDRANKLGDFLHDLLHSSAVRPLIRINRTIRFSQSDYAFYSRRRP